MIPPGMERLVRGPECLSYRVKKGDTALCFKKCLLHDNISARLEPMYRIRQKQVACSHEAGKLRGKGNALTEAGLAVCLLLMIKDI